ncbi:MAG: hypothetical protein ACKVP5_16810 [Aestuariivirga sp.]
MFDVYWNEFYRILSAGDPPLALQLLVVNTIFFIYFVVRRMRGATSMRREVATTVQGLMLFANVAVLFEDQLLGAFRPYF